MLSVSRFFKPIQFLNLLKTNKNNRKTENKHTIIKLVWSALAVRERTLLVKLNEFYCPPGHIWKAETTPLIDNTQRIHTNITFVG
jgi:hypothetical protein